jgi:hypothetical protein
VPRNLCDRVGALGDRAKTHCSAAGRASTIRVRDTSDSADEGRCRTAGLKASTSCVSRSTARLDMRRAASRHVDLVPRYRLLAQAGEEVVLRQRRPGAVVYPDEGL